MDATGNPAQGRTRGQTVSAILAGLVVIYALTVVVKIALEPQHFQLLFCTYYAAGQAFAQGLDPYDIDVLRALEPRIQGLPYVYPPLTLYLFLPLAMLPFYAAYLVYLGVKTACLIALIWIWHKWFLKRSPDGLFLLVCLMGFNFAIYWDFSAGNISVFEQILLWSGLLAFLRGRLKTFAVLVALAASFKLTLVLFLGLLVFRQGRARWYAGLLGTGVFVGLLGLSSVLHAEMMISFVQNIRGTTPGLQTGSAVYYDHPPASWPLLAEISESVCEKVGRAPAAKPVAAVMFLTLSAITVILTWAAIRRFRPATREDKYTMAIMVFCLAYMMLVPRLMMYSYILAIPGAYYIALRTRRVNALLVLLGFMAVSTSPYQPPGFNMLQKILPHYYPLLLTCALWCAGIYLCMRTGTQAKPAPDSHESAGL